MRTQSLILILCADLIALLVSLMMAGKLVEPIKRLVDQTKRIASGDFNSPLAVKRQDEIGELTHSFNEMADKLERARASEKLTAVGKAAAAIAHNLKNSLVMVHTFVKLFPERYQDRRFLEKFSKVVPRELDSWKAMLQDLTDFSRHARISRAPVCFAGLLDDLKVLTEERVRERRITLHIDRAEEFPLFQGHAEKLKQALLNVIVNAIDAMPNGGVLTLTVFPLNVDPAESAAPATKKMIEIKIQDTGTGIPPEIKEHLFEPFRTTKVHGLGLGLAITREIVEQHGGRMNIQSEYMRGTTVAIQLPIAVAEPQKVSFPQLL